MGITYKDTGVDISAGEKAVSEIKELARSTFSNEVLAGVGHFGAMYNFNRDAYSEPVLVSSTDGVGTKTLVAEAAGRYDTLGRDLVHHCTDDILTAGARPLFFLDYIGVGKLSPKVIQKIVSGFAAGCRKCGCSLVGGEMAEMPDIYGEGRFDLVGTIVGVVERQKVIDGKSIKVGDVLVGLRSSGLHTNGYTLARKALISDADVDAYSGELGCTLGEELLKVHRVYLEPVQALFDTFDVHGLAHVTGGGIEGNLRRVMPDELSAAVDYGAWEPQPVFRLIQEKGGVPEEEMRRTFNMGVGFVVVIPASQADGAMEMLGSFGEESFVIGEVRSLNK